MTAERLMLAALDDLNASGLVPDDLRAREVGAPELAACGAPSMAEGYVIPYFSVVGKRLPFYRIKLIDCEPKYRQPANTGNYIYFPPTFAQVLEAHLQSKTWSAPFIIVTEGEKKACAAVKSGFPAVALGGVDNWRSRTLLLPKDTQFKATQKYLKCKMPSDITFKEGEIPAEGLEGLVDLAIANNLTVIIIYDSDEQVGGRFGVKPEVQRAAATLGYELRHRGIPTTRIRQLILPGERDEGKIGLDDFIVNAGGETLKELITKCLAARTSFPKHPNPRHYVNTKLQGPLGRKARQSVALAILTELDANGFRLRSPATATPYYFDEQTHALMAAPLLHKYGEPMHESKFGKLLYSRYGLSPGDTQVINWLAAQFTGEEPLGEAEPKRIIARPKERPNCLAVQISDGQFALITPSSKNPLEIHYNGTNGLLFEAGQVEPTDHEELENLFYEQLEEPQLECWWLDVFRQFNMSQKDNSHVRELAALLFYISPWLNRWRGTQLPIEMLIGEAGSGKSSIYALRLEILTGRPTLRNLPKDIRDWHAAVVNCGALHVTDNVKMTSSDLSQRLSDEMCRITTEPYPHVEMRKLYSTVGLLQMPVDTSFALTAIQQPFHNADLLQRAAVFNVEALRKEHDGNWVDHQIERRGGRTAWLAHQLAFLHLFVRGVTIGGSWDPEYTSVHRLINYEQSLCLAADIFGMQGFSEWIPEALEETSESRMSEADWVLEGLQTYAEDALNGRAMKVEFGCREIAEWAQSHDDFAENFILTNSRKLSRYMTSHKRAIERLTGIFEMGSRANRRIYKVEKQP